MLFNPIRLTMRNMRGLILAFIAFFATAGATAQINQTFKGVISHVEDGDTVSMLIGQDRVAIRLADIDAPEVCHKNRDPQCYKLGQRFGHLAAAELSRLTLGKQATAVCRDSSYQRIVCYLYVEGANVNLEMARSGLAWWESRYGRDPAIKAAADAARRDKRGLFSDPWPVEPSIWRRDCWGRLRACAPSAAE